MGASLSLPLKTSSTATPVAYDTVIDGTYNIYTAQLKNYPLANAFTDTGKTSQEKWGLQVSNRSAQNTIFGTGTTFGTVSGTAALSINSITYPFTKTIGLLDSGNVQNFLYQNGIPTILFNETTNKITGTVLGANNTLATGADGLARKSYIATNVSRFLIKSNGGQVQAFPINAQNIITSTTALSSFTVLSPWAVAANYHYVAAVVGQYIWVVAGVQPASGSSQFSAGSYVANNTAHVVYDMGAGNSDQNLVLIQLLQINSGGVISQVAASTQLFNGFGGSGIRFWEYFTINLANTASFARTSIFAANSTGAGTSYFGFPIGVFNTFNTINVGFDGTGAIFVSNLGTNQIQRATAAGFTSLGVNGFESYLNTYRYRNTSTKLSTATANTVTSATNTFKINNITTQGTFTNLHDNTIWMYEMTGTNNEDDTTWAFRGVLLPCSAINGDAGLYTLKANGVTIATQDIQNTINFTGNRNFVFASPITINATKINFQIDFPNVGGLDMKIGFGLTGGTYAAPTGATVSSTLNLTIQ